ncbi:membrane protein insertase YidC [Alphaproteobacteria bacterium]|nr:membrane protein insertase YidC [Alphaproteobacteria bacterium]
MSEQKNLIIAIICSLVILLGFQFFYEFPKLEAERARQAEIAAQQPVGNTDTGTAPAVPGSSSAPQAPGTNLATSAADPAVERAKALADTPRITIDTPNIAGSIALRGGHVDDIVLKRYRESLDEDSDQIHLLQPLRAPKSYYAEFGWVSDSGITLPNANTLWQTTNSSLRPDSPIVLTWDNGGGQRFEITYQIDDDYMITVDQKMINSSDQNVTVYTYGFLSRGGTPDILGFYILHEGPLGVFNETLTEVDYDTLQEDGKVEAESVGGWIGITDKFWLAALIPAQKDTYKYRFSHRIANQDDRYQVDYLGGKITAAANGGAAATSTKLFAGAKEVEVLDKYAESDAIDKFDLAIDFGWFYFLTKPFFYFLNYLNNMVGNFGIAILVFTVVVKAILYPLANKSYKSMAKMRELTPKLQQLRERYSDDKQKLNQEMMDVYKKEKVNPASGCLPIIVQIPIFFALYKVLFVSIEMRHAPFYGWINDLSVPDPTTLFNLFGLIPWSPPDFMMIGLWPILMGLTMFIQQRLNPQPTDPVQAKVFMFLPLFFTFLLANFAAGLVIYWTWNNILSILQQRLIMWRMGVK